MQRSWRAHSVTAVTTYGRDPFTILEDVRRVTARMLGEQSFSLQSGLEGPSAESGSMCGQDRISDSMKTK